MGGTGSGSGNINVTNGGNNQVVDSFKDYNKGDTQKLILESCLFGCLFYIVSHNKFSDLFKKAFGEVSKDNMNIVLMFVFLVIYYLINYLI